MSGLSVNRRGITVLALLLLIIALAVGGFFLVRYLQSRPATAVSSSLSPHQGISFLMS